MMNMMPQMSFGYGVLLLQVLHWFFVTLWLLGAALCFVWAMKHLSGEKLKTWAVGALLLGMLGSLLVAASSMFYAKRSYMGPPSYMMNGSLPRGGKMENRVPGGAMKDAEAGNRAGVSVEVK